MILALCPRRYCATSYEKVSELVNNAGMYAFDMRPDAGDLESGA